MKQQLTSQASTSDKRKVSFDTSEEDKSSDLSLEIYKEKEVSEQDFNQEIDHQTLQQMIQEKLDSAQNSAARNDEQDRSKKMRDMAARMETKSTKSYISQGSMHSARMKDT